MGMFVTATFHGKKKEPHAAVPATAILHLHDRDWVYVPAGDKKFQRQEVVAGDMLPNNMQEDCLGLSRDSKSSATHSNCRTPSSNKNYLPGEEPIGNY